MTNSADTGAGLGALALAWLAGTALHLQLRDLPAGEVLWGLGAIGAARLAIASRWPRARVAALLAVLLFAFALAGLRASARLDDALDADLEGIDLVVTGVVAELPQRSDTGLRFAFAIDSAARDSEVVRVPPIVQVGWFIPPRAGAGPSELQRTLGAGQRWCFTLRLRRPHGLFNPGGLD